jgi:hypothetical protein
MTLRLFRDAVSSSNKIKISKLVNTQYMDKEGGDCTLFPEVSHIEEGNYATACQKIIYGTRIPTILLPNSSLQNKLFSQYHDLKKYKFALASAICSNLKKILFSFCKGKQKKVFTKQIFHQSKK